MNEDTDIIIRKYLDILYKASRKPVSQGLLNFNTTNNKAIFCQKKSRTRRNISVIVYILAGISTNSETAVASNKDRVPSASAFKL